MRSAINGAVSSASPYNDVITDKLILILLLLSLYVGRDRGLKRPR